MNKIKFSTARVEALECAPGKQQTFFWDSKTPGLGVRVTERGAKSYIFETRLFRKTLRVTIGDTRTWPLVKAQSEATKYKMLTDQGIDPRAQQAAQRAQGDAALMQAKRKETTLATAWPVYLASRESVWSPRTYSDHARAVARAGERNRSATNGKISVAAPLAALLDVPLVELSSDTVSKWLQVERATRPTQAALCFRMLQAFVRWTEDAPEYSGLIPERACSSRIVRESIPKVRPKADDCLEKNQLGRWFKAVQSIANPTIRTFLQALLITGSRREEMATLKWGDVNFALGWIVIRDKVEGARKVPLPPYLAALLRSLQATDGKPGDGEWVFRSSRSKSGRLVEPRIAHLEALESAGLPHLTLHGLRRSFGTLCDHMADTIPPGVVAQIMGHKPSALVEKHYRRRTNEMLLDFHKKIERWMLDTAEFGHLMPNAEAKIATEKPAHDGGVALIPH